MNLPIKLPLSLSQIASLCIFAVLLIVHLAIGSNFYLVLVLVAISIVGVWPLQFHRLTFSMVYVFILSVYSGFGALIVKALLWQPLESNLVDSAQTVLLLAVGFASAVFASRLSSPAVHSLPYLALAGSERLVLPLTLIGFLFQTLHIALRPQLANDSLDQTEGFGGFGSLYFLLLLGVALQFYWYGQTRSKWYLRLLFLTCAAFLVLSLLGNVKRLFLDFLFISALSIVACNIRIQWARLILVVGALGLVLAYLSPAIHLTRDSFQSGSLFDRLAGVYDVLAEHEFSLGNLHESEDAYFSGFAYSYRPNGSYVFPSTMNVDRFCLIFPLDQVVRAYDDDGQIGLGPFVTHAVKASLPSLLVTKDAFAGADLVAWQYGIRDSGSIARPVIGLTASAVAAWGSWGALLLPVLILLPMFIVLDRFPGQISGNPVAVMLIVMSANLAELGIDGVMLFFLRQVPLALIVSVLILRWGAARPRA